MKQRDNFKAMKDSMHQRDKETQGRLDAVFNLQSNALKQKLLYKHYSAGELPFSSLNEIQIHENELATATTFNVSFRHLLDNDLYLENVYYEKEYSDTGAEYLAIKDLDDVDEISSKDRATILNTRAKMVLGISPSAASFFTLVPKKDAFFYDSYGNTLDRNYDFASMYRNRKLLKLDANTVYVQKPKGSSANREFVKLVELVNLTGVHSMTSLPEFDSGTVVNELISNEFNGRIMVNLGNTSKWRILNEATSFILTDDGLFAMIPGDDSLTKVEFTNTKGIDKWVLGGFHSIAGEPTLILVAKDTSNKTRVFYVSIEVYPLLFDGNTIREMLGVDIDGVNDSPIADIQQLIPYVDDTLATFTSGGFLQFNSFKYGFPEKAKEFLTSDTKTNVPNLHRFDSVAKMDMPFIGSLDSEDDVQRVSIDSLDRTTIGHDFIDSSLNLGNGALYWYSDGNKVKAKKFGTTDIKNSLFWDVSPAGSGISVSKDELVAVSTKLLLFLKQEAAQASTSIAKTLYAFIRKSAEYRYQDPTKGENWGWGIISDNDGSRKTTIGQAFNTYNCTFFQDCERLLESWFDITSEQPPADKSAESKVADCTAYTNFTNKLAALNVDELNTTLKYVKNSSGTQWTLGDFMKPSEYANIHNFRGLINDLKGDTESLVNRKWRSAGDDVPKVKSYILNDQSASIAEELSKMFIAKVNMEIGSSTFFDLVKFDKANLPTVPSSRIIYNPSLQAINVEREAKALMTALFSSISTDAFTDGAVPAATWKKAIAKRVANTTYFSDWETYAIKYAEWKYGGASGPAPAAPASDVFSVRADYESLAPLETHVSPTVNVKFKLVEHQSGSELFPIDFEDVRFSGSWTTTALNPGTFVANSIDAIGGSEISFTIVANGNVNKITDISYIPGNGSTSVDFSVTFGIKEKVEIDDEEPEEGENEEGGDEEEEEEEDAPSIELSTLRFSYPTAVLDTEAFAQIKKILVSNYPLDEEHEFFIDSVEKTANDDYSNDLTDAYVKWSKTGIPAAEITVDYFIESDFDPDSNVTDPVMLLRDGPTEVDDTKVEFDITMYPAGITLIADDAAGVAKKNSRDDEDEDDDDGFVPTPIETMFKLSVVDYYGNPVNASAKFESNSSNSKVVRSYYSDPESQPLTDQLDKIVVTNNEAIASTLNALSVLMTFSYNGKSYSKTYDFPLNTSVEPPPDYSSDMEGKEFKFHSDEGVVITEGEMTFALTNEEYAHQQIDSILTATFDSDKLKKIFDSDVNRRKSAISNMSKYFAYAKLMKYTSSLVKPTYSNPSPPFPTPQLSDSSLFKNALTNYWTEDLTTDNALYILDTADNEGENDKYTINGTLTFRLQVALGVYYYYEDSTKTPIAKFAKSFQNEVKLVTVSVPFTATFYANILSSGKYEIVENSTNAPTVAIDWANCTYTIPIKVKNAQTGEVTLRDVSESSDSAKIQFNTKFLAKNSLDNKYESVTPVFAENKKYLLGLHKDFIRDQYNAAANAGIKKKINTDILMKCGIIFNRPSDVGPTTDDDIFTILLGPLTNEGSAGAYTRIHKDKNQNYRNIIVNPPINEVPNFFSDPPQIMTEEGKLSYEKVKALGDATVFGKAIHSITLVEKIAIDTTAGDEYKAFSRLLDGLASTYKFSNPYPIESSGSKKHEDEFNKINNALEEIKFSSRKSILPAELFINTEASASSKPTVVDKLQFVDLYANLKSHLNRALASSLYYSEKKTNNLDFFNDLDPLLDSLVKGNLRENIHDTTMNLALQKVNAIHTKNFVIFDFVENQVPERMYCIKANNEVKKDLGDPEIDTPDDGRIFGVVGRKAMSFTESALCGVISDSRIFTEKQAFTPVPYEVKTFPYDIERWEPANTSCTAMVYWLKVPYQEGVKQSTSEYDLPDGTYAYIDDDGLVGFLDALDIFNARHTITNVAYTPSIGKVFFTVWDSNDVYVTDASAMKLKRDRVHKINLSVDCDMFKTRYSGNPIRSITSMFLSDRDEALRSEGSFKGKFNLVVQFDDNSLHRFTFTNKLESLPYSQVALSNTFADENLSSAYRQFSGTTINDISPMDSGIAVFTGNTYYTFEDGYARKEDVVLYPTLLKSFPTADNVYTSYYLSNKLVLTCVNTSGPLQDMYPYHQISLPKMIPELYSLIEDNLIVYDVDMTAWSSESTVSYIIMYTNKGVYLVDMGMTPGKLKYDDKQAIIDYFVERSMSGLEAHLTSKHHDKTILSRFNNWRRKISDNTVYDFASLTTNTEFTSPTEMHGGQTDNPNVSVLVDKQVFGNGTLICSADENPGVVFAAVQSPITKYDETWKKAQLASPLVDTQFYDYFYRSDTAPNGATLLSGMMNLNHLPFIYRFNTDKTWDMWVNIPSTMTPYMNRVVGSSANIKGGRVKVEGNIAKLRKNIDNVGLISDPSEQATTVRLYINTGHFHMDSITDAVISGSSLPMHVYRDTDANDGLFDGVQLQSVWNRQVQTVTDKHGITYAMIEFRVWGADEQSVRLHGNLAVNTEE